MSPTQRTLAELRRLGWQAVVVEKRNPHTKLTHDVWGFGDILACGSGMLGSGGIVLIQCTTQAHVAARVTKITTECREKALCWMQAKGGIEVWGWAKRGPRGKRKLWSASKTMIRLEDLEVAR